MPKLDKRVDAYITKSNDFAKPILIHIRALVHKACPDVEETIKWGFPNFEYKGPMCSMASFKQHCAFTFWKAALLDEKSKLEIGEGRSAMGNIGKITSVKDLPSDKIMTTMIKQAMKLNDEGVKIKKTTNKVSDEEAIAPDYFLKALSKNKKAEKYFNAFPNGQRKEYIMWITEAKTEETLNKRMATAIEWLSEGKRRNWKYEKAK
ncbi:MAG: YdeI/OmpD-associated family protein [Bacteroidetes bacterium]|nr:YdeI/OmpD-associated family protein [Bacteroidota bacterium]